MWVTLVGNSSFVRQPDLTPSAQGTITLTVEPEALVTISSTSGQTKGAFQDKVPPSAPFPASYTDDFDSSLAESCPRYFADQSGSFQVMPAHDREGMVVRQQAPQQAGVNKWSGDSFPPLTVAGDVNDGADRTVKVDVQLPRAEQDRAAGGYGCTRTRTRARPHPPHPLSPGAYGCDGYGCGKGTGV